MKSVRIQSFPGPYFPVFGLNIGRYSVSFRKQSECGENTDQNNSDYGHFSRSEHNQENIIKINKAKLIINKKIQIETKNTKENNEK